MLAPLTVIVVDGMVETPGLSLAVGLDLQMNPPLAVPLVLPIVLVNGHFDPGPTACQLMGRLA